MTAKAFGQYLKTKGLALKPTILPDVRKATREFFKRVPAGRLGGMNLHPSGLYDLCPRQFVLNYWQPALKSPETFEGLLRMQVGGDAHDHIQNRVLGPMGVLHGGWRKNLATHWSERIPDKANLVQGFYPDIAAGVQALAQASGLPWLYQEERVYHPKYRISGKVDGTIQVGKLLAFINCKRKDDLEGLLKAVADVPFDPLDIALLEIKTAAAYMVEKLKYGHLPPAYSVQASIYEWLTGVHRTIFVYVGRDSCQVEAVIPHRINWDDISLVKTKARIIWEAIRDETLPDSMMTCATPTDTKAKKCPHSSTCFGCLASPGRITTPANFSDYVKRGKDLAAKEGRELLDLSGWAATLPTPTPPPTTELPF